MCHLGYKIKISGLVQGVGFRPLVYELALKSKLFGEVRNDGFGIEIILACTQKECENFIEKFKKSSSTFSKNRSAYNHANFNFKL